MSICKEWEKRTRMGLAYDKIDEIWQKDVNNYVFRFENGKYERKGSYIKENNALDNDMPILNIALMKAITENIPIEKTINECNDLVMFQKILKISLEKNLFLNSLIYLKPLSKRHLQAWCNSVYLKRQAQQKIGFIRLYPLKSNQISYNY